jgi:hypothetical protein
MRITSMTAHPARTGRGCPKARTLWGFALDVCELPDTLASKMRTNLMARALLNASHGSVVVCVG